MSHLYSFLDDRELYGSGAGGGARGDDAAPLAGPQVSVAMTRQHRPGAAAAPQPALPPAGPDVGALLDAVFGGMARVERRLAAVEERIAASLERLAALEEKRAVVSRGDGWCSWAATLLLLALLTYPLLRATSPRAAPAPAIPVLVSQPPAAPTPVLFAPTAPSTFLPAAYASLART